jgi:predicted lipoprotein with Yx(FWY)xxD motif
MFSRARISPWQLARFAAAALLAATGAIHLDLYLTGYRTIPTIGWLFLAQVISAFALALAELASASRLLAAAGAGFLMSTLVGYLLALRMSLFGFREVRTTAGTVAGVIEIVGLALLLAFASRPEQPGHSSLLTRSRGALRIGRWAGAALVVLAVLSLGISSSSSGIDAINVKGRSLALKVTRIDGVSVLTNARGYTLYWFAPDTPTSSHCTSTCAAYWPPVIGAATTKVSVAGHFTTVTRSNGALQVTYNGHPLYTYIGDAAPGQNSGNDVKLNGGWWYEMKVSK